MANHDSEPTIINEDGVPFVDASSSRQQRAASAGFPGFPGGPGAPGAQPGFGFPGAYAGGLPPIPEELQGRNGKLSIVKLMGWKGIAIAVLIVAAVVGLAAVSFAFALIAIPILILAGGIASIAAKVRKPRNAQGGRSSTTVVVRR